MKGGQNAAGATSVASIKPYEAFAPLAPLSTSRNSSFQSSANSTPASAMAGPGFLPTTQSLRPSQSSFLAPVGLGERDATKPIGTPFSSTTPPALSTALIRRLPTNTSEETLRLMMVFSKDLHSVEVLPLEQSEDAGFRAALLKFKTTSGALEAKQMLDGKSNISNDADMIVEILDASPTTGRLHPHDANGTTNNSAAASSSASSAASSRQPSRFNGAFSSLNESVSMGAMFSPTDMSSSDSSVHYQSIFSPQSPIGNHLTERNRISGKTLINNDSADDDETGELLMDPLAYAENGSLSINQRRSTMPTIPVSRLASLSLNTTAPASAVSVPSYGQHPMASLSANTLSPGAMGANSIAQMGFNQHYRTHHYPPANPADQNPPCNTLYVGNLPIDTSEEELKAMFSKCRGYKRLCFRTKQNGPMCFVEFEDVSAATKALHELYGHPLHNSVKGGIRLSFSKNPLGVRSNQNPNALAVAASMGMNGAVTPINPFTSVNGPPPGLSAPPGLGLGRLGYSAPTGLSTGAGNHYGMSGYGTASSNMWGPSYPAMAAGIPMMTGASGFPPHMMGR